MSENKKFKKILLFLMAVAVVFRLFVAYKQMMFIYPGYAPIDDDLYFKWAQSNGLGIIIILHCQNILFLRCIWRL